MWQTNMLLSSSGLKLLGYKCNQLHRQGAGRSRGGTQMEGRKATHVILPLQQRIATSIGPNVNGVTGLLAKCLQPHQKSIS